MKCSSNLLLPKLGLARHRYGIWGNGMIGWLRRQAGLVETFAALAVAWVLVFVVPFRQTTVWLGGMTAPTQQRTTDTRNIQQARFIARRVARLARYVPWRTTCLVQAIAGRLLLRRRGIAATIRFGVAHGEAGLSAHAWLIVGDQILLGGAVASDFQPLADLGERTT